MNCFRQKHKHAYTLVEILIVLVIIAVLAAVSIPQFMANKQASLEESIRQTL